MGVLFDYFAAPSDELAATTIDVLGGPDGDSELQFETVPLKGLDPVVQLGELESLMTGVDYETIADGPRSGHAVAIRDEGERLVLTITDELQAALAEATDDRLREVAEPWSRTFWGDPDPNDVATVLGWLATLARSARSRDERLYCWVCV